MSNGTTIIRDIIRYHLKPLSKTNYFLPCKQNIVLRTLI